MSFDPEKAKEYCINNLKKGNEEPSEGRMRANMANKHVGSSASELFDMPDNEEMEEVYPKNNDRNCKADLDEWCRQHHASMNNEYHSEEVTEIYPKDKPEPTSWEYYADKPPEDDPNYGSTSLELQFTIHHGRFIEVSNMTIDLGIIPLIGYQDGLLTLVLVIGEKFEHYPCSEANYEALQAIWMKVRLTGL